jgi:methionine synthase I (cobalamin-dependent)
MRVIIWLIVIQRGRFMEDFAKRLKDRVPLFDGSMGALLGLMGVDTQCPDLLSVTRPDLIRSIHEAYVEAGAEIILTNTFGATSIKLERAGLEARYGEIVGAAVQNARAVAGGALVALDFGPSGRFLAPVGDVSFDRMLSSYRDFCRAGRDAGADLVFIETQTDLAEMRCALIAARETGLSAAASSTYNPNARTLTGGAPDCAALICQALGAAAAGINCSGGPREMLPPLRAMRAVCPLPVVVQPNAGLPSAGPDGRAVFPFSPEEMAPCMAEILEAGASAIGGCCGTTPAHIARMRPLAQAAKAPESAWDGVVRICSTRVHMPLEDAAAALVSVRDLEALYDLEPDECALIDLTGLSPGEARETCQSAQTMTSRPLAFKGEGEALDAALAVYAGVAAVDCRGDDVPARWGALRL